MSPRRAWVREKRRPQPTQVDPTVALLPMLNYLGCRPNNPAPRRDKIERQESPDFEAIEIVTPKNQQQHNHHHQQHDDHVHQSSTHHQHTPQEQPIRQVRTSTQELPSGSFARAAKTRTAARPTAVQEAISRPYQATTSRLNPYSPGGARPHAGAHTSVRPSPHMSRAMAVNLNAITPLAM